MKNNFEYLRIDGRKQLPLPWSDYPVLTEYETIPVYREGHNFLDILIGRQDGWWVAGVHIQISGSGGGFNPSRKWGQFTTRGNALLWVLGYVLSNYKLQGAIRQAVFDRIDSIRQLKLF